VWQRWEAQVEEQNNQMTPSLGFNKPESANFTFDCIHYLMPKESISNFSSCGRCAYCFTPHALTLHAQCLLQQRTDEGLRRRTWWATMFRHWSLINIDSQTLMIFLPHKRELNSLEVNVGSIGILVTRSVTCSRSLLPSLIHYFKWTRTVSMQMLAWTSFYENWRFKMKDQHNACLFCNFKSLLWWKQLVLFMFVYRHLIV